MEITTKRRYNKVLKTSIILCWVFLIVCFIIKLFGGNFFDIAISNERFIKVFDYIDTHCLVLIQFLNYYFVSIIYFSATYRTIKLKPKDWLIISISVIVLFVLKLINVYLGSLAEITIMFIFPITFAKQKWWKSALYILLYYIFGYISLITKNLGGICVPDTALMGLIFSIDIYFMLLLFMFYNLKEEE